MSTLFRLRQEPIGDRPLAALRPDAAEERLLAAGCSKINLQVGTSNTAVLDFYRHIGYLQDDVVGLGKRLIEDGPKT